MGWEHPPASPCMGVLVPLLPAWGGLPALGVFLCTPPNWGHWEEGIWHSKMRNYLLPLPAFFQSVSEKLR